MPTLVNWLEIAAQAWCDPRTASIEMQPELATVFAEMLEKYSNVATCICAAGLPDPECPQHGVYSVQAGAFYDNAYRVNIQSKCAQLTGILHKELLDTGLVTIQQWNDKIAPALVAVDQSVETPREWAERVVAPLTPYGEHQRKLQLFAQTHGHWLPANAERELRRLVNLQSQPPLEQT